LDQSLKNAFDPDFMKRRTLMAAMTKGGALKRLNDGGVEARIAGTTNIDLFELGKNKGFNVGAFIEKAGTGGGLFRRLLAQGAFEIAQMTGDEATTSLARSANRAAEAWTTVARWPPPGIGPHVVESATPRSRPWPFRSSRPS